MVAGGQKWGMPFLPWRSVLKICICPSTTRNLFSRRFWALGNGTNPVVTPPARAHPSVVRRRRRLIILILLARRFLLQPKFVAVLILSCNEGSSAAAHCISKTWFCAGSRVRRATSQTFQAINLAVGEQVWYQFLTDTLLSLPFVVRGVLQQFLPLDLRVGSTPPLSG